MARIVLFHTAKQTLGSLPRMVGIPVSFCSLQTVQHDLPEVLSLRFCFFCSLERFISCMQARTQAACRHARMHARKKSIYYLPPNHSNTTPPTNTTNITKQNQPPALLGLSWEQSRSKTNTRKKGPQHANSSRSRPPLGYDTPHLKLHHNGGSTSRDLFSSYHSTRY